MNNSLTSFNTSFFNKYFTNKEFEFINDVTSERKKLDKLLNDEMNNRDILIKLINKINNSTSELQNEISASELLSLLSEIQQILEKVDTNIQDIQNLKESSIKITSEINNILARIESNPYGKDLYLDQIQEFKSMINDFSFKNEDIKAKVSLDTTQINTLLHQNIATSIEFTVPADKKSHTITHSSFAVSDNNVLVISEKEKKVFLPYSAKEISSYIEQFPNQYKSPKDVIKKEFILSLNYYMKRPIISRFRETYSLVRDRESKSIIEAFKYSVDMMFRYNLNPAIIAACKTQNQLEDYLSCLERNKLDEFKHFEIKFEVTPLKIQ